MGISNPTQVLPTDEQAIKPVDRTSRLVFIVLCVVASGVLTWLVSGSSRLSLLFFAVGLFLIVGVSKITRYLQTNPDQRWWLIPTTIVALVTVFVIVRLAMGQVAALGFADETGKWIGLSYLTFRLIHVLIDSQRLGSIPTGDLAAYALFPPALIAGPIHRANDFLPQLDKPHYPSSKVVWIDCLWRIGVGITKKMAFANFFGLFALTATIAENPQATRLMLWASLFAYGLMLYFDFAGYTDIVIGIAGLFGIRLPENFANPYAQPTIARFWQTWHMSLSFWVRDYVFFPINRFLLKRLGTRWSNLILAVAHLTTMVIVGLWHGFSSGFIAWGLWHGLGLFIYAQWSRFLRPRGISLPVALSTVMTFLFVMLGWSFFALQSLPDGLRFLLRLF